MSVFWGSTSLCCLVYICRVIRQELRVKEGVLSNHQPALGRYLEQGKSCPEVEDLVCVWINMASCLAGDAVFPVISSGIRKSKANFPLYHFC